jgi:hypothetical protein
VPQFFRADKFRLNKEKIMNPKTYILISSDEKVEWMFKAILGSFHKQKRHPIGIFTDTTLNAFNQEVKNINTIIEKHLDIVSKEYLATSGYMSFKDFISVKHEENEILGDSTFDDLFAGSTSNDKKDSGGDKK